MINTKTIAITFALLMIISIVMPLCVLETVNAHTPTWEMQSWAYIEVNPSPVGINQKLYISMWVDKPLPDASVPNDVRRHNYELTITKPDKTVEKQTYPICSDTTGVLSIVYIPNQIGTYSFVFHYPQQVYTWNATSAQRVWTGDIFKEATSSVRNVTVQQEPIPEPISSYPLPQEYWTRPIEGQNTDWWTISSNWLGCATYGSPTITDKTQKDGLAPNSPHIMWTKPIEEGGVVGGTIGQNGDGLGSGYYSGISYNRRFSNPIIMGGRLYYDVPSNNYGGSGVVKCVDLRTGSEIWTNDYGSYTTDGFRQYVFSFGYIYDLNHYNQHGIVGDGWLFRRDFSLAAYPETGKVAALNITNVPSGYEIIGLNGEHLRYVMNTAGRWLAQWNSSNVFTSQSSGTLNASLTSRYDWNVSISSTIPSTSTVRYAIVNDILLFSDIVQPMDGRYGTNDPYTIGAISLKPGSVGTLLWMKTYSTPTPQTNTVGISRFWTTTDPINRVIIFRDKESMVTLGYSMDDGSKLWEANPLATTPEWEYFSTGGLTAYGNFYYSGYGGVVYCWDTKDGSLKFTYGNGGPGNSTYSGLGTPWGLYPLTIIAIADGKIYAATSEHSPDTPLYKDATIRCIDANNGTEKWKLLGYDAAYPAIADGYLTYLNIYDFQITTIGKGPSQLAVTAPQDSITLGRSLIISGSVTDISAGTKQNEQAARFPDGVPCVSEQSMKSWMEYVYMQKPRPTDTTGVPVTLSVLDANGNYRGIGTVTSDANGFFTYNWTPDIPGQYNVYVSFDGSESYWPSHAETSFAVDPAAPTPVPTEAVKLSTTDQYFVPAVAGIIVVIAIGFAVTILVLRKRS